MNQELVEKVAEAQFGEVWRMARNAGHGNSTEAMITDPVIGTVNTFWFWGRPLDIILLKLGEDS